jgi:hypothetical protein
VNISPRLRPLLRDIMGADADDVPDDVIELVAKAMAEVKYQNVIFENAGEAATFQFSCYQWN